MRAIRVRKCRRLSSSALQQVTERVVPVEYQALVEGDLLQNVLKPTDRFVAASLTLGVAWNTLYLYRC